MISVTPQCLIFLAGEAGLAHPDGYGSSHRGMAVEMTPHCERFVARRALLAAVLSSPLCDSAWAQQVEPGTLSDAIRFFAHEKSAAEQYAVILSTVSKNNVPLYVRGIRSYADAKAEFDALIAELRFDLQSGQEPARSAKFNEALKAAAEKRVAFTSFVSDEIDKLQGARPGLPDVIQAVPELVKAITDAGLSIWKAFHESAKERRDAILNELEHLEWRSFAELAKP
jgi:hypothetical protein